MNYSISFRFCKSQTEKIISQKSTEETIIKCAKRFPVSFSPTGAAGCFAQRRRSVRKLGYVPKNTLGRVLSK